MISGIDRNFFNYGNFTYFLLINDEKTESQVLQDLELKIEEIDASQLYVVDWCKENCSSDEYKGRIIAAKKILNCYSQGETELDLRSLGLTTLPQLNLPNLRLLCLQNNELREPPNGLNLPNLWWLTLQNNKIRELPNGLNFPNLNWLNLTDNKLKELPNELNLPNLEDFCIENNELRELPNGLNLPKLKWLNLKNNKLKELPNELNLPNLEDLYLQNNELRELPNELNLPNLRWLYLENNKLTELPNELNLPNLRGLHLQNNELRELPNGLNLPNLESLHLENNKVKELPSGLNLPKLNDLCLQNYELGKLSTESQVLQDLKLKIEEIDASQLYVVDWCKESYSSDEYKNRIITVKKILNCYSRGEARLDLSSLGLTTLPRLNLPNLQRLDLQNNELGELPNGLNLPDLQYLNLENNKLKEFPNGLNLLSVRYLYLKNNELRELPNGLNLPNIREFNLDNNELRELPNEMNLPNLKWLPLKNNKLRELPNGLNLPNLEMLSLENNKLRGLPNGLNLPNLEDLYLKNNKLRELPNGLDLPNLKSLSLENNKLRGLPNGLNLPNLEDLYLKNNKLRELPNGLDLPNLKSLNLENNELRELPISLAQCRELTAIHTDGTQIESSQVEQILAACRLLRNQNAVDVLSNLLRLWSGYAKSAAEQLQFILKFSDEEKIHMHEWLVRLSRTQDFRGNQQELANIVCAMLADLTNESFKKLFMSQVETNNEACQDRSAMALNELYLSWKILVSKEDEDTFTLLASAGKTLALRKILSNMPEMAEQGEGVEIYLYYETHLRARLGLLTAIRTMAYEYLGQRNWVNVEKLVQDVQERYVEEAISLPIFDQLFSKDKAVQEECERITQEFSKKLEQLEEQLNLGKIDEGQYMALCEQCKNEREQVLNKYKQTWFLSRLSSGSGSN